MLFAIAGVLYALGFLTIMMHTARFGIQVIEVIKPLNFWVGAPPAGILLMCFLVWDRYLSRLSERLGPELRQAIKKRRSKKGTSGPVSTFVAWVIGNLLLGSIGVFISWSTYHGFQVTATEILNPWFRYPLFCLLLIAVLVCAMYWTGIFQANVENMSVNVRKFLLMLFLVTTAVLIVAFYVYWVYPSIPQRYGGGRPVPVRLLVNSRQCPLTLVGWSTSSLPDSMGSDGGQLIQGTKLLYKSTDSFIVICEGCPSKVVSIARDCVRAVLWDEATADQPAGLLR
ncbi:hypothetical protein ACFL2T_00780 [Elusimicrobiota bacterium]